MSDDTRLIPVEKLEVVGYADCIKATAVPVRRAPVFRFRDGSGKYVFPPFRLIGDFVMDGAVVPESEFVEMVRQRRATNLAQPVLAQPAGMLWIDEGLVVHYGPQDTENKQLRQRAAEQYTEGLSALVNGDLNVALRCAQWASAADQQSLNALALEAAVLQLGHEPDAVALIRRQAQDVPDGFLFDREVRELAEAALARSGEYRLTSRALWTQIELLKRETRQKFAESGREMKGVEERVRDLEDSAKQSGLGFVLHLTA